MNWETSWDGWPLIDPDRDVIGLSGAPGALCSEVGRVREAHARIVEHMMAEKAVTRQEAGAILLAGFSALYGPAEREMRRRIAIVFGCLEHIVRTYPHDQALQDYLDLPPSVRPWVSADLPDVLRRVDLCRWDLLGDRLSTLRVLEFNANCPVGIIRDGLLAHLWRQSSDVANLLDEWNVATAPFEQQDWFVQRLLALGTRHGVTDPETRKIALFHDPSKNPPEFAAMEDQIVRAGRTPVLLDPTTTAVPEDVRLGHLKYSRQAIRRNVDRWNAFCARIVSGRLVVPNPPAGRLVAGNKLCLAVMSDPRFQRLFTAAQRQALEALVPWSRKLGDGITVAEAIADQQDLVLKAPYGSWGEAVYLGCQHGREDWSALLRDAGRRGWLVQQYVPAPRIDTAQGHYYRGLGVWIVDGNISGYISKISRHRIVNVTQGGAVQVVFGRCPPLDRPQITPPALQPTPQPSTPTPPRTPRATGE